MRNRDLAGVVVALALTITGLGSAGAQDYSARVRGLDSLAADAGRAWARVRAHDDSLLRAVQRLDTVVVGQLRLLVERPLIPLATAAARAAIDSLSPAMGTALDRLRKSAIAIRYDRLDAWQVGWRRAIDTALVVTPVRASRIETGQRVRRTPDALTSHVLRLARLVVFEDAAPKLLSWTGGAVPIDSVTTEEWRQYRMALVSSPAALGRKCYDGDLGACAIALQLDEAADPILEWYDAADRRRIVRNREDLALRVDPLATRDCLATAGFSCITLLRKFPAFELPQATTPWLRAGVARYAVAHGGAGAVERMLEKEGAPAERLAAAAGAPLDSVLRGWQRRVRDTRAPSRDLSFEVAWVALAWSIGLGLLSLRSSRWR